MDRDDASDQSSSIGKYDANLESKIDLRPDPLALELTKEVVDAAAGLVPGVPGILDVLKAIVVSAGIIFQRRKAERSQEFILGLYERLQQTRSDYVRRDEFMDLLEDSLRRFVEQPDQARRADIRRILLHIIDGPPIPETSREHVMHKLFVRFADELPGDALKILAATRAITVRDDQLLGNADILSQRTGIERSEVLWWMDYLANENLFDTHSFNNKAVRQASLEFLLSPIGRMFEEFRHS